ncbi:MAG: fimbrial protein [Rickettsiales bacterium]|mgnify:CR=1 FL=1|nr:fimbrial protein [Rickettsiales bacterium]
MIRINLLPIRAARKKEEVKRQLTLFVTGLVLILGVGLFFYQGKRSVLVEVEAGNRQLEAQIADLKRVIGEVDEYKAQQEQLEQKLGVIRKLKANKTGPVHMLDELALRIPEKLWLTSIEQMESKATIEGISINNEVIATFMSRLEESQYFTEVYLVSIQAAKTEDADLKLKDFRLTSVLTLPGISDEERVN